MAESMERRARRYAEELERDAVSYPEERDEILLEAAGQWAYAGEDQRALKIWDDLIATASPQDAQFAAAEKFQLLARLGRDEQARAELDRLTSLGVLSGPASLVAEALEAEGRLEEALTWFNRACRDLLADDPPKITADMHFARSELSGRARVRAALGMQPDALDRGAAEGRAELDALLGRAARRRSAASQPHALGSFFVRSDVERAFAEGLVHADDLSDTDVTSYYHRIERGWRQSARQAGVPGFRIVATTVEDLLKYAADHGLDPKDQQTRVDHLQERVLEGAQVLAWPPGRNEPCWCGSDRKYKKCCGAVNDH